jgi:chemotaxis receptor (MCP) glutamine deamidase CheD
MDAADTAYISVKVFGGAQVVDYTNSTFTGALIG